jgi:hypothetical protein
MKPTAVYLPNEGTEVPLGGGEGIVAENSKRKTARE